MHGANGEGGGGGVLGDLLLYCSLRWQAGRSGSGRIDRAGFMKDAQAGEWLSMSDSANNRFDRPRCANSCPLQALISRPVKPR